MDNTTPGFGRAPYSGQDQTRKIFGLAATAVSEIVFQPATGNMSFHYDPTQASPQQGRFPTSPGGTVEGVDTSVRGRFAQEGSWTSAYGGGLPPQPEPHPISPGNSQGPSGQFDRRYPSNTGPIIDEFGQQQRDHRQQPQAQTMGAAGPSKFNPPRLPNSQAENSSGPWPTMPNRNWDYSGRINNSSYDEPPSPSVPTKDTTLPSLPPIGGGTVPPTLTADSGFSRPSNGPGSLPHPELPRRSASGISETNADLVLAYYHSEDATDGATEPTPTAGQPHSAGGHGAYPSNESDAYAADGTIFI